MRITDTMYRVIATETNGWDDYSALYGTERRCYARRKDAERQAREFSRTGDWDGQTPPVYDVEAVPLADATPEELAEVYTGTPLGDVLRENARIAAENARDLHAAELNANLQMLSALEIVRHMGPSCHGAGTVDIQSALESAGEIRREEVARTTDYTLRQMYPEAMSAYDRVRGKLDTLRIRALCYSTDGRRVMLYGALTHQRNPWVTVEQIEAATDAGKLLATRDEAVRGEER